jgi:hypothetical protein
MYDLGGSGSGGRSYIYGTKSRSVPGNGSRGHTTGRDTTTKEMYRKRKNQRKIMIQRLRTKGMKNKEKCDVQHL